MANRHLIRTALVCVSLLSLSGCGIGFNAGTNTQKPSGNGAFQNVGDLEIRNATIVANPNDPSSGTLIVSIYNNGEKADALTNVSSNSFESQSSSALSIGSNQILSVGLSPETTISLASMTLALVPGTYVNATFSFENAPSATLPILVNANTGIYKDIKLP